jgi:predicted DNA-binding transcriptional regulator AlpA
MGLIVDRNNQHTDDPKKMKRKGARRAFNMEEKYITAEELTKLLPLPLQSIWRYARQGIIPCLKIGRRTLFNPKEVLSVLKEQKEGKN